MTEVRVAKLERVLAALIEWAEGADAQIKAEFAVGPDEWAYVPDEIADAKRVLADAPRKVRT